MQSKEILWYICCGSNLRGEIKIKTKSWRNRLQCHRELENDDIETRVEIADLGSGLSKTLRGTLREYISFEI
jgi:hypothetical protein